ncbi:MAG: SIS domain-containing protein [Desulfobacterota bacterium]|nr:SIS domain-containing protein [Thermodesulfobacteriota bacterium]
MNIDMAAEVDRFFGKVIDTLNRFDRHALMRFVELVMNTYERGGTIFVFGNGGSGNTASHFCGDFIKGVSCGLQKRFKMICLNDNTSALMAIANDISYEDIFVEQLKNFLQPRDMVIGISCSGNSINVLKALAYANSIGAKTVAMCGFDGGKAQKIAQLSLHANINDMEVSEDIHLIIMHCVKQIVIKMLKS